MDIIRLVLVLALILFIGGMTIALVKVAGESDRKREDL